MSYQQRLERKGDSDVTVTQWSWKALLCGGDFGVESSVGWRPEQEWAEMGSEKASEADLG